MDWGYGCYIGELGITVCNGILLGELHDPTCSPPNPAARMEEKVESCCNQPMRHSLEEITWPHPGQ